MDEKGFVSPMAPANKHSEGMVASQATTDIPNVRFGWKADIWGRIVKAVARQDKEQASALWRDEWRANKAIAALFAPALIGLFLLVGGIGSGSGSLGWTGVALLFASPFIAWAGWRAYFRSSP
jgi:hypothetical protein